MGSSYGVRCVGFGCLRALGGGGGGSGALGASGGAAARIESWPGANWAQRSDFRS